MSPGIALIIPLALDSGVTSAAVFAVALAVLPLRASLPAFFVPAVLRFLRRRASFRHARPRCGGRLGAWLLAPFLAAGVCAHAQPMSEPVPASWVDYASTVGQRFQSALDADGDDAQALRRFLDEQAAVTAASPPRDVALAVWPDAGGRPVRVEFDSLGNAQADAALHRLLSDAALSARPPQPLREPLRLKLRLRPDAGD
ncbi:hypothetical protein WKR88_13235 [Trinickia caryophylli]|uniref:Uncharacterized protein n=1 Tax=Trinickia caryophylli TaxID=28094 RepID=A0A1X7H6M4_TRICW|nr:hypothetical protein [Trinickia caryophylli]PMS09614.1 hypothetical protein C0Z17_24280 [Trinickia caryophylli]TRX17249.1 hypothetical protein FNF07_02705 [Trinickia caryophylli]WQE12016.1 hypothetical protein U0034_00860 [Trinickia caryophylli]SMF79777.1 hypothetical protein SAMN06295900_12197 [Trinickia caryophylli]GLU35591.1 hypothetical protein Busp01_54330 [Trinickia caryophylli]